MADLSSYYTKIKMTRQFTLPDIFTKLPEYILEYF